MSSHPTRRGLLIGAAAAVPVAIALPVASFASEADPILGHLAKLRAAWTELNKAGQNDDDIDDHPAWEPYDEAEEALGDLDRIATADGAIQALGQIEHELGERGIYPESDPTAAMILAMLINVACFIDRHRDRLPSAA
jgi:hypothetical protein